MTYFVKLTSQNETKNRHHRMCLIVQVLLDRATAYIYCFFARTKRQRNCQRKKEITGYEGRKNRTNAKTSILFPSRFHKDIYWKLFPYHQYQ